MSLPDLRSVARLAATGLVCLVAGCGLLDAPGDPLVVAHRSGAGNFPENSRAAITAALEAGYGGIEVDLTLTRDGIPVLSHDPWLHVELCTRADGTPLPESPRILIPQLTLEELHRDYRCGGLPVAAHPDAAVVAGPHVTLDELIELLQGHPDVTVQLDVKQEPEYTASDEAFASAILGRWYAAALPNPWLVTSNRAETLRAFRAAQPAGKPLETLLIWPRFTADTNTTAVALASELSRISGVQDLRARVQDAQADGIAMAYQVADHAALQSLHDAGVKTGVWTVDAARELEVFCTYPLDYLITDYVERAPCRR